MKKLFLTHGALAAIVVAGLSGSARAQPAAQKQDHDHHEADHKAAPADIPAGWSARLDSGSTKAEGVRFMTMGAGVHFMTGPAGVYWKPDMTGSGAYQVTATFNLMEPSSHPNGYGLFIGGANLTGATQKYTYFLVRQDGKFMIRRRDGANTPTVVNWTDNPAVKKTAAGGQGQNTLAIAVAADKVRFLINGTEVHALAPADVDVNGLVGLRINHALNVHVEGFGVK